jgi:selenocysteine lyase/cysteine desulfurase
MLTFPDRQDSADPSDARQLSLAPDEFAPEVIYLNTASLGLPPRRALTALGEATRAWTSGTASPPDYDVAVSAARAAYAGLVGVAPANVAVGSHVSVFAGMIASSLPVGSEVLTVAGEFTSVVFPFLAQHSRGIVVRSVPLDQLAASVTASTALVAVSAVQSADGQVADLDALTAVCASTGTKVLLDTTQAIGWLPVDASRFAYTCCGGYKWLLAPRGTCFFTVSPEYQDDLIPSGAGWYAGDSPWDSIYSSPMRLAPDARRFDVSPAWHSWVGQAAALQLLAGIGTDALHTHALHLADRFRAGIDLPPGDSAIVSLSVSPPATERLAAARIAGSVRAGRLRLAFHLYNTVADVDATIQAITGSTGK